MNQEEDKLDEVGEILKEIYIYVKKKQIFLIEMKIEKSNRKGQKV